MFGCGVHVLSRSCTRRDGGLLADSVAAMPDAVAALRADNERLRSALAQAYCGGACLRQSAAETGADSAHPRTGGTQPRCPRARPLVAASLSASGGADGDPDPMADSTAAFQLPAGRRSAAPQDPQACDRTHRDNEGANEEKALDSAQSCATGGALLPDASPTARGFSSDGREGVLNDVKGNGNSADMHGGHACGPDRNVGSTCGHGDDGGVTSTPGRVSEHGGQTAPGSACSFGVRVAGVPGQPPPDKPAASDGVDAGRPHVLVPGDAGVVAGGESGAGAAAATSADGLLALVTRLDKIHQQQTVMFESLVAVPVEPLVVAPPPPATPGARQVDGTRDTDGGGSAPMSSTVGCRADTVLHRGQRAQHAAWAGCGDGGGDGFPPAPPAMPLPPLPPSLRPPPSRARSPAGPEPRRPSSADPHTLPWLVAHAADSSLHEAHAQAELLPPPAGLGGPRREVPAAGPRPPLGVFELPLTVMRSAEEWGAPGAPRSAAPPLPPKPVQYSSPDPRLCRTSTPMPAGAGAASVADHGTTAAALRTSTQAVPANPSGGWPAWRASQADDQRSSWQAGAWSAPQGGCGPRILDGAAPHVPARDSMHSMHGGGNAAASAVLAWGGVGGAGAVGMPRSLSTLTEAALQCHEVRGQCPTDRGLWGGVGDPCSQGTAGASEAATRRCASALEIRQQWRHEGVRGVRCGRRSGVGVPSGGCVMQARPVADASRPAAGYDDVYSVRVGQPWSDVRVGKGRTGVSLTASGAGGPDWHAGLDVRREVKSNGQAEELHVPQRAQAWGNVSGTTHMPGCRDAAQGQGGESAGSRASSLPRCRSAAGGSVEAVGDSTARGWTGAVDMHACDGSGGSSSGQLGKLSARTWGRLRSALGCRQVYGDLSDVDSD